MSSPRASVYAIRFTTPGGADLTGNVIQLELMSGGNGSDSNVVTDTTILDMAKAINTAAYPAGEGIAVSVVKTASTDFTPTSDYSSFA